MEQIKKQLPNATLILVFGILSIVGCLCYGILGLIFGIVALVLAKKDRALYASNPDGYTGIQNVNTGRILAIIGIVLSVLLIIYMIVVIGYIGWDALTNPELLQERVQELQG